MIQTSTYVRPASLGAALAMLADVSQERRTVLAGGTDVYPAHVVQALRGRVLDVSAIAEMRGLEQFAGGGGIGLRLGALTTWSDIASAPLPPAFAALSDAAREIGGLQIQNRGTLGGNLCNASPAADGIPPLLAFDARVELRSARGRREVDLAQFVIGNRRTAMAPDELLVAVHVPPRPVAAASRFLKLGHRRYLVISIAMVTVALDFEGQHIARCAVAVGACGPVACRLPDLENAITGRSRADVAAEATALIARQVPDPLAPIAPIDDIRATATYRRDAVRTLIGRALTELAQEHA